MDDVALGDVAVGVIALDAVAVSSILLCLMLMCVLRTIATHTDGVCDVKWFSGFECCCLQQSCCLERCWLGCCCCVLGAVDAKVVELAGCCTILCRWCCSGCCYIRCYCWFLCKHVNCFFAENQNTFEVAFWIFGQRINLYPVILSKNPEMFQVITRKFNFKK